MNDFGRSKACREKTLDVTAEDQILLCGKLSIYVKPSEVNSRSRCSSLSPVSVNFPRGSFRRQQAKVVWK